MYNHDFVQHNLFAIVYVAIRIYHHRFKMMLMALSIALCLAFTSSTVAQQTTIYLLPQSSSTVSCPVECCYTFRDLQDQDGVRHWPPAADYSINTALILLPGIHTNNHTILFSHATNFSLVAANSSLGVTIIQCDGSAGFSFEFIQGLLISGIEFRACESFTQRRDVNIQVRYSLLIFHSRAIELRNTTVKHGQSIGLAVANVYGDFSIIGCRLLSSHSEHLSLYMHTEQRDMQHTSIIIIDSQFTGTTYPPLRIERMD